MPTVTSTAEISAPVDRVYSFIADQPEAATTFIPGLNRISNVSPGKADVGQTWEYEFNWFGLVISGQTRCTRLDRPRSYQFQTVTGNAAPGPTGSSRMARRRASRWKSSTTFPRTCSPAMLRRAHWRR